MNSRISLPQEEDDAFADSFKDRGKMTVAGSSFLAATEQPIAQVDAQDGATVYADISTTPNLVEEIAQNNLRDPRQADALDTVEVDRNWVVYMERQVEEAADDIKGASQEFRGGEETSRFLRHALTQLEKGLHQASMVRAVQFLQGGTVKLIDAFHGTETQITVVQPPSFCWMRRRR